MFRKLRLILADWIAPNDFDSRILLASRSIDLIIPQTGGRMLHWETYTGLAVAAAHSSDEPVQDQPVRCPELQCNICTNLFPLAPGQPYECPSCGSRDLNSTGKTVER